jgi:hypothetical protein
LHFLSLQLQQRVLHPVAAEGRKEASKQARKNKETSEKTGEEERRKSVVVVG